MNFPDQITFKSDKNVIKLVEGSIGTNGSKEKVADYIYTKSATKKGTEVSMQLSYIERLLSSGLIDVKYKKINEGV